ncbi:MULTISPECIES: hypothetical protein [unclassified Microbacterium]|uniref:hypothetical protein n=1 Tax=unclassified Microbacterium TaxID=2609290 RepID=UPI00049380F8|nr:MULTISPECIES: hypothetical protein [unclassified Microbacterium]
MQIQIDPFAFGTALFAVLIAWRAHFLAKSAPEVARRRELRDSIRAHVQTFDSALADVDTALQMGKPLPEKPEEVETAAVSIHALASRVPEEARVLLLHTYMQSVASRWSMAHHDEVRLLSALDAEQGWQDEANASAARNAKADEFVRRTLSDYRGQVERGRRAADASRTTLREGIGKYKAERKIYIDWLDELDRSKGHGSNRVLV